MAEPRKRGAATPAPPKKVNVELEGEIRRRLKVYVAQRDMKIKDAFNEALDEYLSKRGA